MITDAQLNARLLYATEAGGILNEYVEPLRELQQLRAAKRAGEERVRQVVVGVLGGSLAHDRQTWTGEERAAFIDAVATRVASQLASEAPVLSAEDLAALQTIRDEIASVWNIEIWSGANDSELWKNVRRGVALLDRLLGASR